MLKYLKVIFCFLAFYSNSHAQVISPLDSYPFQHASKNLPPRNARTTAEGDTLQLPFFDDFSAYTGQPSSAFWLPEGGVYVNDQFGINPPSLHVATFEGINAAGLPYSNINSYGYTDALTSKPIVLAGLNPTTANVYFSFHWQAGGLGGSPNTISGTQPSFLVLEFKDVNQNWIVAWQQPGANTKTDFAQVILPISDPAYFHAGFQFRFRSSGVQKGTDDTWNVDYIYLDKNRNVNAPNRPDVALSRRLGSFLERYTAMPANQFFVNPATEVNDSAFTRLNNFNNQFAPITWRGYTQTSTNAAVDTFLRGNAALPPLEKQFLINGTLNAAAVSNSSNNIKVKHAIFLNTLEKDPILRQNDTISRITDLSDYFAYDDGTAETNFSLNNSGNRQLAYKFDLNAPDYVRAIRVYLSKTNRAGNQMTFRIWNETNGNPAGTPLSTKSFVIPPVDSLNRFYDIIFPTPIPVSGSFYIGFSLTSSVSDFVNIGYDLNERADGRIKYNNNATGWLTFTEEPGALMMRPVMGNVTSAGEDLPNANAAIKVYPNPGTGLYQISGTYQQLTLADITGRVIWTKKQAEVGDQLDLRGLAKGIYVLHFTRKKKTETQKIILTY